MCLLVWALEELEGKPPHFESSSPLLESLAGWPSFTTLIHLCSTATCLTRVSLRNTSEVVDWSHDSRKRKKRKPPQEAVSHRSNGVSKDTKSWPIYFNPLVVTAQAEFWKSCDCCSFQLLHWCRTKAGSVTGARQQRCKTRNLTQRRPSREMWITVLQAVIQTESELQLRWIFS